MADISFGTKSDVEWEREADAILAELRRLDALMDNDEAEIERLRSETRALAAETRATLDRIGMLV